MPLWRGGPNTRTLPTVLVTPSASTAADMAHLCVPQNQALGVCRGFVPDIQICGTHGRKNLVNATIISNAEEEEIHQDSSLWPQDETSTSWPQDETCTTWLQNLTSATWLKDEPSTTWLQPETNTTWFQDEITITKLWGTAEGLHYTIHFLTA